MKRGEKNREGFPSLSDASKVRAQQLYNQICASCQLDALTDSQILQITLFVQRNFCHCGNPLDVGIR